MNNWDPVRFELDRWQASGRKVRLWLRDDDAVAVTAALERLLSLSSRFHVPLTLAVIPKHAEPGLALRLHEASLTIPVIHGWSHENHAGMGEKKQELGPHRPTEIVLAELSQALRRMTALFGGSLFPMLVPPWNRIDPALLPALAGVGFKALSLIGPAAMTAPIPIINTHVDLIDWRHTRRCRPVEDLVTSLARELIRAFVDDQPIGVLSHHLVHDEAAWEFLETLMQLTSRHVACGWVSPATLANSVIVRGDDLI